VVGLLEVDVEVVVEEHDEEDVELTGLGREPAKKPKTTIVRSKKTMTATVRPLEAIASGYARR
jgi:hypothetical protein